jgi:hypothetical protein
MPPPAKGCWKSASRCWPHKRCGTCSRCCVSSMETCVAWISRVLLCAACRCKASRCKMRPFRERFSRAVSSPSPSMPSQQSPSAGSGSTGRPSAGGGKYGCGARPVRFYTWSGRTIPTMRLPWPSARMNARWPVAAMMAASSCGTSRVGPCSGRAGTRRALSVWLFPPMAAGSPPAGLRRWGLRARTPEHYLEV